MNLTVPIPDRAATALAGLAKARGKTPEQVIATLVEHYLEDVEDLADAMEALDDGEAPIPLEQVKRDLGFRHALEGRPQATREASAGEAGSLGAKATLGLHG